jgi:hypothetical protein
MQRLLMVAIVPLLVLAMVLSGSRRRHRRRRLRRQLGLRRAQRRRGSGTGCTGGCGGVWRGAGRSRHGEGEVRDEPGQPWVLDGGRRRQILWPDIEPCRAFASAIFNDPNAVEFVPTTGETRFTLLQNGDIDVLVRSTTHTYTRDTDLALNFGPTYFYDGQGLMVRKDSGITKLEDLNGATICMGRGATTELNIADAMAAKNSGLTRRACLTTPTTSTRCLSRGAAMR